MTENEDSLVLNLTTHGDSFTGEKKASYKKERFRIKRQERKDEERLIEEWTKHSPPHSKKDNTGSRNPQLSSPEGGSQEKQHSKRKRATDTFNEPESKRYRTAALFNCNPDIPKIQNVPADAVSEQIFSGDSFAELNLHPHMVSNLSKLDIKLATNVQKAVIPNILACKDVLIKSQTGSGKTLAYAVPIVQYLQSLRPKLSRADGTLAIVIVPTRELAIQSFEIFQKLVYPFTWIVPGCLMGGESKKREKARLRKGLNIVVSTPGRLVDHIQNTRNLELARVEWLVIDEADRLLDMGVEQKVSEVINALNERGASERKTALLSATLSEGVERLAGMSLSSPIKIDITEHAEVERPTSTGKQSLTDIEKFAVPENLKHHCVVVPSKLRLVTLAAFILWKCKMAAKKSKILVFMSTQDSVDFHLSLFQKILFDDEDEDDESEQLLYGLHGEMLQKERTKVFNQFSKAEAGVLFCTDVAARGLDLPQVRWIVQYMPPGGTTDYIHRVGRTARIGSRGNALLFLTPNETGYTERLAECSINLIQVKMNHILQTLFMEKERLDFLWSDRSLPNSIEEAAGALQTKFSEHVRLNKEPAEMARKAYQSYIGAYAAYPKSVKMIFHVKDLHFGHVATGFALQEAPKKIGHYLGTAGKKIAKLDKADHKKRFKTGPLPASVHKSNVSEFSSGLDH